MTYNSKHITGRSILIFPLLAALAMVCVFGGMAYAHGNDIASATSVNCPSTTSGAINFAGDWDFFSVVLTGQTLLTTYTTGSTDTYGYLYDSAGNIIAQDDDSGAGYNFRILESVGAGTYYIAVKHYSSSGTGTYTLYVDCTVDDHGNDTGSATSISCNSTTSGDIETGGDLDYFQLNVGTGVITAYTEGSTDTYGYLYDSAGNIIAQDDDSGAGYNFRILESVGAGTYYIAVKHYSSSGTGTYTLYVDCEVTYVITASDGPGGTISPSGDVEVSAGGSQSFTITPNQNRSIEDVLVDGVSVGAVSSYNFTNVASNHTITASFSLPFEECLDISDVPLDARFQGAPSVIMFVLDDSGSMDWEFMTQEDDGKFQGHEYVFDDPGDNVYSSQSQSGDILSRGTSRRQWKSQWSGYNKMYYDPNVDYEPWPTLSDADPDNPRSHPNNASPTFDLSGIYDTVQTNIIIIDDKDASFSKTPEASVVIVDNDDIDFTLSAANGGQWRLSTGSAESYDGTHYYTRYYGDYTATWTPNLATGEYVVYARWDDRSNRSTAVTYTINHAGGSTPATVNQRIDGGKWVPLGTFNFNGDPAENVALTHTRSGSYDYACADAVRFEPTGAGWDWATSSQAYDNQYWWTPADGTYTATWTPNLSTGNYLVYARWVATDTRSTAIEYTINHANGSTLVTVNQRLNGGEWVELGAFDFDGDPAENVTLAHTRSGDNDRASADAVKFTRNPLDIDITRAHYYAWSAEQGKPYLVVLDAEIKYYAVNDANSNDQVETGELDLIANVADVPSDVQSARTYAEERQNFANWYSFYRKRELTATAAVASVISSMQGVEIGINSINGNLVQQALKVRVGAVDESSTLLNAMYGLVLQAQGTPLRQGLENVGKYYKGESGGIGTSPYADVNNGGECQQVFAIVMTDGYWNGSSPNVGNADGDDDTDFDGSPYGDSYSNTLADVAMYYYENDLSALDNLVPPNPSDSATHQHMVTFAVSFGVLGTLNPDDYDLVNGPYPTWPNPGDGDQEKIDDLWHTAANGRGTYLSASNPTELVTSLLSIMQNIESRTGSASSVSVNGDELYEKLGADLRMFQASYSSDGWSGDVKAHGLNTTTGEVITSSYVWSANEGLESIESNNRIIATYDGSTGVAFRFDNLSAAQKALLDPGYQADDTTARNLLNFLRGDDSNEGANGGTFRDRIHISQKLQKLGDIVHSSPVYHDGVLYTGANDGMLHAFDAETGTEVFAYVPSLVFENLTDLADPNYVHTFFVDATPTVKDVTITGVDTLLVGGLAKGGKGYYALDVSDASSTTWSESVLANRVKWEFTDSTDLGFSYSMPTIVQSNDEGKPWIVIFGNGYESEDGYAKLFILDASNGNLLQKIDTGVGSCNGLSSPIPIDIDYDGKVDFVYAGDLKGNLWKFDFTNTSHEQWGVAYKNGATPKPLFQAKGPGGSTQPITSKPDVMEHCNKHGYLVTFATGQYLGDTDLSDTSTQSMYGIWDYGDNTDSNEYLGTFNRGSTPELSNQPDNVALLQQEVYDLRTTGGMELRTLTDNVPNWGTIDDGTEGENPNPGSADGSETVHAGWYLDLPDTGERVVSNVLIRDGKLIAVTYVPEQSVCGTGGYSWLHEGNACTGGRLNKAQFDIDGNGVINEGDLITVQVGTDGDGNPIYDDLAPTEIKNWDKGRLQPPTILRLGEEEIKYLSSSTGRIETVREKAITLGISHWIEFK